MELASRARHNCLMNRSPEASPDFNIEALLSHCVGLISQGMEFTTYREHIDKVGGALVDGAPLEDRSPDAHRMLANVMARAIWKHCPHPAHRYAAAPLPTPERNATCHCGSGRKYKQCCLALDSNVPLDNINYLVPLVEALPRARWAELADSRIAVDMVLDLAATWGAEERPEDLRDLLQPWFAGEHHWSARYEPLIDLLLDAYTELGNPRKKAALLERAMEKGDAVVRAGALQRRATMAADAGDYPKAWSLFQQAQRSDPAAVNLSHLELVLLLSEGREAEARERARFWLLRLTRMRDPGLDGLIGFVREVAESGGGAMVSLARAQNPALDSLLECWKNAPALASLYRLEPEEGSAGGLAPHPKLRTALARWDAAFGEVDFLPLRQTGGDWWADAEPWVSVLRRHPELWNSFEVLDGLVQALDELPFADVSERLAQPLLDRAAALLREVLRANSAQGLRFEWGWHENRPALNALATGLLRRLDAEGFVPEVTSGLEWCVQTLNPQDNQGLRQVLMRGYLQSGRIEAALLLSDRYPDDFATMRYNRALALRWAGRADEALAALEDAATKYPRVLKFLLAKQPREPRMDGPRILVGGDEEAWGYRVDHLDLWRRDAALEWARDASRALKHSVGSKRR